MQHYSCFTNKGPEIKGSWIIHLFGSHYSVKEFRIKLQVNCIMANSFDLPDNTDIKKLYHLPNGYR